MTGEVALASGAIATAALMRRCLIGSEWTWTSSSVSYIETRFRFQDLTLAKADTLSTVSAAKERYGVSTVERALDVLRTFTHRAPELSLTDIATETGLHKATAFRLLATLCRNGMTMKNPRTGLY